MLELPKIKFTYSKYKIKIAIIANIKLKIKQSIKIAT